MGAQIVDAELVCECGIRFRCPRCQATPQLRLVTSSLVDAREGQRDVSLVDDTHAAQTIPGSHRFAGRVEPSDDPEQWVALDRAAEILGLSTKSLTIMGAGVAQHVRRQRNGRSFEWFKPDLEAIATIRQQAELGFDAALRTYAALVEGRL